MQTKLWAAFAAGIVVSFCADVAQAQRSSTFEEKLEYNFDPARSHDIAGIIGITSPEQCRAKCVADNRCRYWNWTELGVNGQIDPKIHANCILLRATTGAVRGKEYGYRYVGGAINNQPSTAGNQSAPAGTQPNLSMPKQGQPGWTADSRTGCKVWNANPEPNDIVTWSGSCVNGFASGRGVAQFFQMGKPVEKTEGEYRNGKRHGHAILSFPDGSSYDGQWQDDKFNGWGVAKYTDGMRYEGEFRNDKRHGQGIAEYPDGITYQGEFRNNRRHGRGTMIYPEGGRFDGQWNDDKPSGPGTLVTADGQIFSGHWSNGCLSQGEKNVAIATTNQECGF